MSRAILWNAKHALLHFHMSLKVEIWKANPRKKDELWLFPGVHEYPFTYALPIDLPESMDESGYASINYTIKVCYINKKKMFGYFKDEIWSILFIPLWTIC